MLCSKQVLKILGGLVAFNLLLVSCATPLPASTLAAASGVMPSAQPEPTQPPAPTPTDKPYFPIRLGTDPQAIKTVPPGAAFLRAADQCPALLSGLAGGFILGIDPQTCAAAVGEQLIEWTLSVPLGYADSILTMKVSWPAGANYGLKAASRGAKAQIRFDSKVVWEKRADTADIPSGQFYAARKRPIWVTFVPAKAGEHTVAFSLPAGMTWDISSIEIFASPKPTNLLGVAYSPYLDCQSSGPGAEPSPASIQADLERLRHSASAIRTYSATGVNSKIPWLANQLAIPVYAGAWLDSKIDGQGVAADEIEMEGIAAVAASATIEAAIIGNEYILRHLSEDQIDYNAPGSSVTQSPASIQYLLKRINQFKEKNPTIPVGTADVDSVAFNFLADQPEVLDPKKPVKEYYQPILDSVDIFFVHIYPFWGGSSVDQAAAFTVKRYIAVQTYLDARYGGKKRLILGEAGWPSTGLDNMNKSKGGSSAPDKTEGFYHPAEQRQYMLELLILAQQEQVDLFYFDGFDELWKLEGFGGVGRSWGFNNADRSAKFDVSTLLLPSERIPDPAVSDDFPAPNLSVYQAANWAEPIYTEWPRDPFMTAPVEGDNRFRPYSPGIMGDFEAIRFNQCDRGSHSGDTATRIDYSPLGTKGWAGIFWLYPEGNWGGSALIEAEGKDLSAAQTLSIWARGELGGEVIEFVTGGVCGDSDGKNPPYCPDSLQPKISTGNIVLSAEWKNYRFDLRGQDLSHVSGGFGLALSRVYNAAGAVVYIDDVGFMADAPDPTGDLYPKAFGAVIPVYSDYAALDNHYIPSNFMGDGEMGSQYVQLIPDSPDAYAGKTALQITYHPGPNGWGGIYWVEPEGNWGQRPGGYNLEGVTALTFWARGEHGGEVIEVVIGGLSCEKAVHLESACPKVYSAYTLSGDWKPYRLDLTGVNRRDWSQVIGGFGVTFNRAETFYLDEILYLKD